MAIQFARVEYVQRSQGQSVTLKASYNSRDSIRDDRTGNVYYFAHREESHHHEVMLPKGAHEKFKDTSYLWNAVECFEKRSNSVLAVEEVVALPDDEVVSPEMKVKLVQEYVQEKYVDKGLAVQLDIHSPHEEKDQNWHAHILRTTRRFNEAGTDFYKYKARDFDNELRHGQVWDGVKHGELWAKYQNDFFEKHDIRDKEGNILRVDPLGVVPQEHLGPVRMRNIENDALQRSEIIKEANESLSKNPKVVLNHLMKNRSTFDKRTLEWFIDKHVASEDREAVKQGVLGHKSVLALYDRETGEETGLYTTKHVRSEEEKLLRFAEGLDKGHGKTSIVQQLAAQNKMLQEVFVHKDKGLTGQQAADQICQEPLGEVPHFEKYLLKSLTKGYSLTKGQRAAFESVVKEKKGLHIIRGRAGVGKSYVLSPIRRSYEAAGYKVLGLAPTHKATQNLREIGFESTMTAHKFVFMAKNKRFDLPSKSLVVIDEAGMVGTEHYVELMKVIKDHGAKALLVGDERQLYSIERGDMFEELADRFGSTLIHEIKRQEAGWQKEVAHYLAQGQFREAAERLSAEGKLSWSATQTKAKARLMDAWAQDVRGSLAREEGIGNRFILATRNKDVDALNIASREVMKGCGQLGDQDYEIKNDQGTFLFSTGDRIQFGKTDKELGIVNGHTGTIEKLSETSITIKQDNGNSVTFDPGAYQGLRYGYAGTVYKSQGATLDKTYLLHGRVGGRKNNYVALTRHVKDTGVYINAQETPSLWHYIKQISQEEGRGASVRYALLEEIARSSREVTFKDKVIDGLKGVKTKLGDTFHANQKFYNIGVAPKEYHKVTKFTPDEKGDISRQENREESQPRKVSGDQDPSLAGDKNNNKGTSDNLSSEKGRVDPYQEKTYQIDYKKVRDHLSVNVERYARSLLGNETKKVSSAREMVWDKKGSKISLNRRTGQWQDFKTGEKGDLIKLTSYIQGGSVHEAYDHAAEVLGLKESIVNTSIINTSVTNTGVGTGDRAQEAKALEAKLAEKRLEDEKAERQELADRKARVDKLVGLSKPIKGTLAETYLRDHRGIKETELGDELRYLPASKTHKIYKPFLLALAKDKEGAVTACQVTYLDQKTGNKAKDIEVNKRTYGKISGSFVEIQKGTTDQVYIAEGVETALSLKEAGIKGKIVAGLGLHNLGKGNHLGKDLIIVGDHDGPDKASTKQVQKIVQSYGEKGLKVTLVRPDKVGQDFNDVLKEKGKEGVYKAFTEFQPPALREESTDGHKASQKDPDVGPSSQEKSRLEEEGRNQRAEGVQTTAQDQSQTPAGRKSVEGEQQQSHEKEVTSDASFDIASWKAEMERKHPEVSQKLQETVHHLSGVLKEDSLEDKKFFKAPDLNQGKGHAEFIKGLEEKYPEEVKQIQEDLRGTGPEMPLEDRLREVQEIMGHPQDRRYYEDQLGLKLRDHLDYFKDNFESFRKIDVNSGLKDLQKELIQEFKPEVFEREMGRMTYQEMSEKLLTYKHVLETTKDTDYLRVKEDLQCFLEVARGKEAQKLEKACDYDRESKAFVHKTLGIEEKPSQVQKDQSRGFER